MGVQCVNGHTHVHKHIHVHACAHTHTHTLLNTDATHRHGRPLIWKQLCYTAEPWRCKHIHVCKAQGTCLQSTRYMFATHKVHVCKHKVHVCKAQGTPCQFNIEPTCKFCALMKSACVLQTCFNNLQHARKWSRSSATWLRTAFDIWHATWGLTYLTYQSVRNRWVHAVRLWQHTVLAPLWRTHTHAYTCIHTTRAHEHGF